MKKPSRQARKQAREALAEKFAALEKRVEAEAVLHDLIDEMSEIEARCGRAIVVLQELGVSAKEIHSSTGLTAAEQRKFVTLLEENQEGEEVSTDNEGQVQEFDSMPAMENAPAQELEHWA
ncbi:hypothetical protein HMPREF3170_05585 [Corynebacterium sp. HMSC08D02]|uniref:hypothetical protein n=1 Tax=Corynebacterium sp. HMSC08D02 TaxID=1581138 RepID=UPI0008A53C77|nr:hypothetical protein [Corynebacterium sp. HMSC08D02]OFT30035.1 hypothetical protein HMPREF3170_05585 [Corynebacterium sp. HMSC08D02]